MTDDLLVDPEILREQARIKYCEVAAQPHRTFHFHTGRPLAARLGYDPAAVDPLPDVMIEPTPGPVTSIGLLTDPSRRQPSCYFSTCPKPGPSDRISRPLRPLLAETTVRVARHHRADRPAAAWVQRAADPPLASRECHRRCRSHS